MASADRNLNKRRKAQIAREIAEKLKVTDAYKKFVILAVVLIIWDVIVCPLLNLLEGATAGSVVGLPITILVYVVETPSTWGLSLVTFRVYYKRIDQDAPAVLDISVQVAESVPFLEALPINTSRAVMAIIRAREIRNDASAELKKLQKEEKEILVAENNATRALILRMKYQKEQQMKSQQGK